MNSVKVVFTAPVNKDRDDELTLGPYNAGVVFEQREYAAVCMVDVAFRRVIAHMAYGHWIVERNGNVMRFARAFVQG